MKKRIFAVLIVLCLLAAFLPLTSQAAITPYFMAINDTLLPFNDGTMPFVSGGDFFVPDNVFEHIEDIWAIGSDSLEHIRLYRGKTYVDFYTDRRQTVDHDGNTLRWPAARRIGSRFYLPLRQVCDYFGLTPQVVEVTSDIVADQQMYVIRIVSTSRINGETFVGLNRNAIRAAYNQYYAPPPTPTPPSTTDVPPPPVVEPPRTYRDVTIHLSFYDISAGSADGILDLLDMQTEQGFHSCFFVSGKDIKEEPGLIRRISGSGHMIGIWLETGAYPEYFETSALLFEAAKVKTVIISSEEAQEAARITAEANNLVFWGGGDLVDYSAQSVPLITGTIPTESGARVNMLFSCSEEVASLLPGVYQFLKTNEYTVSRITETVEPT